MKDGQLFRVKVIKSEEDLPKEEGEYIVLPKNSLKVTTCNLKTMILGSGMFDWYLIPEEITDADIEAYLHERYKPIILQGTDINKHFRKCAKDCMKAVLNGEIKHIEK